MVRHFFSRQLPVWEAILLVLAALLAMLLIFGEKNPESGAYGVSLPKPDFALRDTLRYGEWPELSNANFFGKVRDSFLAQKSNFVEANLSEMKLRVYENGVLAKEVPILTIGRVGSWWETPAGLYKAESKETNHFSSLAKVHLPWSIPFQGNFFIHGWPYYDDGTPVTTKYSGGCIRLSTEDAKVVYDMITVGEPILVFNERFTKDSFKYEPRRPDISAESYLAVDLKNDYVFLSKNPDELRSIASITKLMTALVATEYINLDKIQTIAPDAIVKTSKARLAPDEKVSTYDLLFPLLMESSNEAAQAYADILGPVRFVNLMNDKAAALGMEKTHFQDPSGADSGNVSTAEDLFSLAKYLYNNRSFLLALSAGRVHESAYGKPYFDNLQNFNIFQDDPAFVGGKVGLTTAAKETIISIFNLEVNGVTRPIAFIALGSDDNGADVRTMRSFIEKNY